MLCIQPVGWFCSHPGCNYEDELIMETVEKEYPDSLTQ